MSSSETEKIFVRLREILVKQAAKLMVSEDSPCSYCLEARVGPTTLGCWGGKVEKAKIPVAWVEIGKAYVSVHLMGLPTLSKASLTMSKGLKGRTQGKTCFNFRTFDEALFQEFETVATQAIQGFRKAGFVE